MNFWEAKILMYDGKLIRRKAWRRGTYISVKDGDQCVTLTVHFEALKKPNETMEWQPYVDDFIENDWEVVELKAA